MRFTACLFSAVLFVAAHLGAQTYETLPSDPYFANFKPIKALANPESLYLKKGDRLAICGDSITEQKMYSRIIETYLTVCRPDLEIAVRQFGWSGERAEGFLRRIENDVLRFNPTVATTCYGMNDHRYRPYENSIGELYRETMSGVVKALQNRGARVILGSPGSIGKVPHWTNSDGYTLEDLNLNLCELRNIDIALADELDARFNDIFWPMLKLEFEARQRWGDDYAVPGKDGVHPGWAGQVVMAYGFLEAMGLDGEIGSITLDLATGEAAVSNGHKLLTSKKSSVTVESHRYPFCATGPIDDDNSIRSGMALVPFNENLNRFTLKLDNATDGNYEVTWGDQKREFTADALKSGVNLAADFEINPFSDAFNAVDKAVADKQAYETRQIKTLFHGPEGRADMEATVRLTEKTRAPLVKAIKDNFRPVTHSISVRKL